MTNNLQLRHIHEEVSHEVSPDESTIDILDDAQKLVYCRVTLAEPILFVRETLKNVDLFPQTHQD